MANYTTGNFKQKNKPFKHSKSKKKIFKGASKSSKRENKHHENSRKNATSKANRRNESKVLRENKAKDKQNKIIDYISESFLIR